LTATADDGRYSSSGEATQNIASVSYYVDIPPWWTPRDSTPMSMTALDGSFDETKEEVEAVIDIRHLEAGRQLLFYSREIRQRFSQRN